MKPVSLLAILLSGMVFGFGLALSTMIKPEVVLNFLRFQDFGLVMVLGGRRHDDRTVLPVRATCAAAAMV